MKTDVGMKRLRNDDGCRSPGGLQKTALGAAHGGHGLPHGQMVAIKIELRQAEPPGGHVSVHTVGGIDFGRDEPLSVERGAGASNVGDCARLLTLLPDFVTHSSETIPDFMFGDFACRLAAVQRQPRVIVRSDCNLAGVSEEFAAHPTPLMVRVMPEAAG